jgi:type IV pilus assembly protein PilX
MTMPLRIAAERGASLIVVMLMMIVVLSLGVSAAQLALQGEKVSRNDRDRQVAVQAAEAGLMDAEQDIEKSPDPAKSRSALFAADSMLGFVDGCGDGGTNLGLCTLNEAAPAWKTVDFMDQSSSAKSVPYGKFTGQLFQAGSDSGISHTSRGSLPARLPRYIIELMRDNRPGAAAGEVSVIYRITAIGFGMRNSTQAVLQTMYKKEGE